MSPPTSTLLPWHQPLSTPPASVNPSTAKFCFLSGFLDHLPSAKHSKNLFQSPWAGRDPCDHVVPASAESWCSSRISLAQAWMFLPLEICTVMPLALLHLPFGPSPAPPSTHHPPHSGLWLGARQPEATEQHVHGAHVPTGLPAARSKEREGSDTALLPLSTDKASLLIWAFPYTWHKWNLTVPGNTPLSNVAERGL